MLQQVGCFWQHDPPEERQEVMYSSRVYIKQSYITRGLTLDIQPATI